MNKNQWSWMVGCAWALGLGCNVESKTHGTAGVDDGTAGAGGAAPSGAGKSAGTAGNSGSAGPAAGAGGESGDAVVTCPRGVTVVMSDYSSTQVALSDLNGKTRSASFISTASTETSGLAFALSGDVVVPSTAPASGRVILLDRFGTNVITWVDPRTTKVEGQLAVGTGFESNPQDYVEVDEQTAWVSRWGQNSDPGQEDYDTGGDLLIIDTESFEIIDSLVIEADDDLPPRPAGMTFTGKEVVVALDRVSTDWATTGEARLMGFSATERRLEWQLELKGLKACGRPVPYQDGERWLVACTGALTAEGDVESLDQSALVVLDPSESPPRAVERIAAADIAGEPLQNTVVFAGERLVLLKTQTQWGGTSNNRWLAYDLKSGETTTLVTARPDADGNGQGLVFGGMVCAPGCTNLCLLADADRGVLDRAQVGADGDLELLDPVEVENQVGLPPVGLTFR